MLGRACMRRQLLRLQPPAEARSGCAAARSARAPSGSTGATSASRRMGSAPHAHGGHGAHSEGVSEGAAKYAHEHAVLFGEHVSSAHAASPRTPQRTRIDVNG
jgi:hypothetical protein